MSLYCQGVRLAPGVSECTATPTAEHGFRLADWTVSGVYGNNSSGLAMEWNNVW